MVNKLGCEYRLEFNRLYLKLSSHERSIGAKVFKEIFIGERSYAIIQRKNMNNNGYRYKVKVWTGKIWRPISSRKNPRLAVRLAKEHANEEYALYA